MNNITLWIITALYGWQTAVCFYSGVYPQGLILFGYVIANCGLIWSLR